MVLLYSQLLLHKVAQLEEAWAQKEKFIHSSRMIVKFREDHISRLEKKLKGGQFSLSDKESEVLVNQLKAEINILKDQVQMRCCMKCRGLKAVSKSTSHLHIWRVLIFSA